MYREPSGRVVITKEHISQGGPALFARIPRVHDRRGMIVGPVNRERAAVKQYYYRRLAHGLHFFEQLLLHFRQRDVGAIAAAKAFERNLHLFAFDQRRESEAYHDHIRLSRLTDGVIAQHLLAVGR